MKLTSWELLVSQSGSFDAVRMMFLFLFILAYSSIASILGVINVILQLLPGYSCIFYALHDIRLL